MYKLMKITITPNYYTTHWALKKSPSNKLKKQGFNVTLIGEKGALPAKKPNHKGETMPNHPLNTRPNTLLNLNSRLKGLRLISKAPPMASVTSSSRRRGPRNHNAAFPRTRLRGGRNSGIIKLIKELFSANLVRKHGILPWSSLVLAGYVHRDIPPLPTACSDRL